MKVIRIEKAKIIYIQYMVYNRVRYTCVCVCVCAAVKAHYAHYTYITHNCVANIRFIYIYIFLRVWIFFFVLTIFSSHTQLLIYGFSWYYEPHAKKGAWSECTGSRILGFTYENYFTHTTFYKFLQRKRKRVSRTHTHSHTHGVTSNEVLLSFSASNFSSFLCGISMCNRKHACIHV